MLERCSGGFEDFAHRLGVHALNVPQTVSDVDDEAVCGLLRQPEIPGGVVALRLRLRFVLLRDGALLDSDATLPIRKTSEGQSNTRPAARPPVRKFLRRVAAWRLLPDERLRFLCRIRRPCLVSKQSTAPLLPTPVNAAASQVDLSPAPSAVPASPNVGVLPDPSDVGVERLSELIGALLEPPCGHQRR